MIKLKMIFYTSLFFLLINLTAFSQQDDYSIVKKFKELFQEIEFQIKQADSLDQLDDIEVQIDNLQQNYIGHKVLLDKSLYPDDFTTSITKLRKQLFTRKGDFTKITVLTTKVSELTIQVEQLNEQSKALIAKVQDLAELSKSDHDKISQLQKSIASLRVSLRKRDDLVISILDSILPAGFTNAGNLSSNEKQKIISKASETNIIDNIEKAINENIRFLQVTTLAPDDIESMNAKRQKFENTWRNVGDKISGIYSAKSKNTYNFIRIDSSFAEWNEAINMAGWNSIKNTFANNGIYLNNFTNGKEFTSVIKNFTLDEIKNVDLKNETSKNDYKAFADSGWFGTIKPTWVPFLIDNNMLTEAQKDTIEANIARWKEAVEPNTISIWIYIIGGVLILMLIVLFTRKNKNNTSSTK